MDNTNLVDTFNYYSNLMKKDFIMSEYDTSILDTASLFNSYTTNPSDFNQKQQQVKKIPINDKKSTKNKKKRINIRNATIRRHSHIRYTKSNHGDNNNNDQLDNIEI